MITVKQVDQLVIGDDAVAARLWPRLGPKVRQAYTADRDGWVGLRRKVEAGETLSASTLAAQHKVFSGWARALRAASTRHRQAAARSSGRPAGAAATAAIRPTTAAIRPMTTTVVPPVAAASLSSVPALPKPTAGAGTAVAGGLLLAGLVAVAARRKRA